MEISGALVARKIQAPDGVVGMDRAQVAEACGPERLKATLGESHALRARAG